MCGFLTFFSNHIITSNEKEILDVMLSSINHRGPDSKGVYTTANLYLGFQRLSIIDIDNGIQPFSYENDQYKLVFNGEIYNYIELRNQLIQKGYQFFTESEAEVILALYKCYGEKFVHQLRGMFAFVIWDNLTQTFLAARDRFGIKPLFYTENETGLYCASESKSLLYHKKINMEVNRQSLYDYLSFQYVPEPNTMLKNIYLLEPGSVLIKQKNKPLKIKKFASLNFYPQAKSQSSRRVEIKTVLEESVNLHMRSDVPVGTFLSGGIDSSIITALARKQNPNIKTFTVGFDVEGYSEVELAKQTAKELRVENISVLITPQEFIEELPKIIWSMDSPVADPSAIPLYFICKEARKHVKVVLSGEGSDELFGGYNIYHEPTSLQVFSYIPAWLKKIMKGGVSVLPEHVKGKSFIERGCTPFAERY